MGNYINVDLDKLKRAKAAIFAYELQRKQLLASLNTTVESTSKSWRGDDSEAFMLKWEGLTAADGVFSVTQKNIVGYYKLLEAAYSAYRNAQAESIDQASKIGGW